MQLRRMRWLTAHTTPPSPQVAGTTNGESLVYDSTFFVAGSAADGMVQHVASGKLGVEGQDESITAIAWHNSGYILAGTATGAAAAAWVVQAAAAIAAASPGC